MPNMKQVSRAFRSVGCGAVMAFPERHASVHGRVAADHSQPQISWQLTPSHRRAYPNMHVTLATKMMS